MNKKTKVNTNLFIGVISLLMGIIIGMFVGFYICIYTAGYLLDQIHVDKVDLSFNETLIVDTIAEHQKDIIRQHDGEWEDIYPNWESRDILWRYNLSELTIYNKTNITVHRWNTTTGKFEQCCYPIECGKPNPPDCKCVYPVKCVKIEETGPFNHPLGYL